MSPLILSLFAALGASSTPTWSDAHSGSGDLVRSAPVAADAFVRADEDEDPERFDALLAALDPKLDEEAAVERLASMGTQLARLVLDWHRTNAEDGAARADADPFDEGAWRRVERAAERIDRGAQQSAIAAELTGDDPPAVARAAFHLLRRVGSSDQADLFVELLLELDVQRPGRGEASDLALSTFRLVQARDRRLSAALGSRIGSIPNAWRGLIAHDLARVGAHADDLAFIWRGLEMRVGETPLLSALAIVADDFVYRVDDAQLHVLRRRMLSADLDVAEQAIMAASRLGDDSIVEQLIAFLTQSDPRIRAAAAYGLTTLTDLPFGQDVELWEHWYERAETWWDERGRTLADDLRWAESEVAIELILEVARQRMRRAELVDALIGTFERTDDEVVDLAVLCLRELHWHGAPRRLVQVLESHQSARVQGIAWRALRTLTGLDAGPEADDWRLALLL